VQAVKQQISATIADFTQSREALEQQLGNPCRSLAYPYGDYDERVVEATRAAGYAAAATLPKRLRAGDPLAWPRVGVYNGDDERRFRAKVSPAVRRVRASPAWAALEAARAGAGRLWHGRRRPLPQPRR